ncbi:hypothetical protein PG996_015304 [Apiospora saccharicola]|uniref:TRP C-terminal domain-containing protein n=1 Tax=Apiospora saccharicola TaxID=335842 RepID=A0ABR1TMU3_9PEZI
MEYLKILQSAAQELPAVAARLYKVSVTMYGYLSAAFYWATVPLRYPAYYVYVVASRVLSVLLSPLWFTWKFFSSAALMVVNIFSGFKLLFNFLTCAIIVGLVAALVIHLISRLITMLLSVHPSQQQKTRVKQETAEPQTQLRRFAPTPNGNSTPQQQQPSPQQTPPPLYNDDDLDGDDDYYYVQGNDGDGESLAGSSTGPGGSRLLSEMGGATTTTTSSESAFNVPNASSSRRRGGGRAQNLSSSSALSFGGNDMYKRDWRSLSSNMKSNAGSRRGCSIRSLLAQTIHEESSESDSL